MTLLEICVVVATMFWCGMMLVRTIGILVAVGNAVAMSKSIRQSISAHRAAEKDTTTK